LKTAEKSRTATFNCQLPTANLPRVPFWPEERTKKPVVRGPAVPSSAVFCDEELWAPEFCAWFGSCRFYYPVHPALPDKI
jgi:hypothetical protein